MKASETRFLPFLQGTKQFIIPIYQRTYSWTLTQCEQLWDDIKRVAANDTVSGHFVGSIVYIDRGLYQVTTVPELLVIDGQQRLTTLSLLLAALGKAMEERQVKLDVNRRKIKNNYLLNNDEDDELRYKLLLTQSDKETLISIVDGAAPPANPSLRLTENYEYFLGQLRRPEVDLATIYHGIGKLIIVDIALDRERDNPQLIFESLNSTGLKLSQADLIRNYILMGLPGKEQTELYNEYWFPMEQGFGHAEYAAQFDRFMRDYLTIKTGRIPNIGDVYTVFKSWVQAQPTVPIKDIVAGIFQYSTYFVRLAFHRDNDPTINQILTDINTLRVDVAYPFLLQVYDDYEQHRIDRSTFIAILRLVESYVFRRLICGIPTNSLNKTFVTLYKEVKQNRYLDSLKAAFVVKDSYRRFPGDEEFQREFVVKDVYSLRNRNYLLRKLENFDRDDLIDVESHTIERILPPTQHLPPAWREELGPQWKEIQAKYVNTIGNVTLTDYAPDLGERSFSVKRDAPGGFASSLLSLNHGLATLEAWNEAAIQQRADVLAAVAVKVWEYPSLPDATLRTMIASRDATDGPQYTLDDHAEYLTGAMLDVFESLRKRILNLDSSVREEVKKQYIAYKSESNFVDIVPQKSRLRLSLNMRFDEIDDPKGLCKDVTNLGRWGNGDVEVGVATLEGIDDVMPLIRQAYAKQRDEVEV